MTRKKNKTFSFEIIVNNRTYMVKATPYKIATGETRFRVSYNESPVHIFGWDDNSGLMTELEELSEKIPPVTERVIAHGLEENYKQLALAA